MPRPGRPIPKSPTRALTDAFAFQVRERPGAVAVQSARETLSYAELDRRSAQLAQQLRNLGIKSGCHVGLASTRSCALIVGILGILKSGAAYLPLDPDTPAQRRRAILEDSGARVLVVEPGLAIEGLPANCQIIPIPTICCTQWCEAPGPGPDAQDAAYLLYTSGSTGQPKGVGITHANVTELLVAMRSVIDVGPGDVVALAHSFTFDVSVYEIFATLCTGATLWIPEADIPRSPLEFHAALRDAGVTILCQTPTAFRLLLLAEGRQPQPPPLAKLRCLLFAGERLDFQSLSPWLARYGATRPILVNLLGLTETTVYSTAYTLTDADAGASHSCVGRPLPGMSALILDESLAPVTDGKEGELYLSGWGLSRGYWKQPELTQHRFVSLPKHSSGDTVWHRTGDRVRRNADGAMEYLGRSDTQIKLRGHRIELGEIEFCLRTHAAIADAVVLLEEPAGSEARLVACLIGKDNGPAPPLSDLVQHVAKWLPEVMRPARYGWTDTFPRTANGKLDRAALLASITGHTPVAPHTPGTDLDTIVLQVYRSLLATQAVDPAASFFELGGNSLLAFSLILEIDRIFSVGLRLREVINAPSAGALSKVLRARNAHPNATALADAGSVPRKTEAFNPTPATENFLPGAGAPVSSGQAGLWIVDGLLADRSTYNVVNAMEISGHLDSNQLHEALNALAGQHATLHSTYGWGTDSPVQRMDPTLRPCWRLSDLSGLAGEAQQRAVHAALRQAGSHPFDLAKGPILRGHHLRLGVSRHVLVLSAPHIAVDGWSMAILWRELGELYSHFENRTPFGRPATPSYLEHVLRQRKGDRDTETALAYWRNHLEGLPQLALPLDRPRPARASHRGALHVSHIGEGTLSALRRYVGSANTTLHTVLITLLRELLALYSGQSDFGLGILSAGRDNPHWHSTVGLFANTLVLRCPTSAAGSLSDQVHNTQQTLLAALEHSSAPFDEVVAAVGQARSMARNPLVDVFYTTRDFAAPLSRFAHLPASPLDVPAVTAKFDLSLSVTERNARLELRWEYATELFNADTIVRLARHFDALLCGALANPQVALARLNWMGADEAHQVLVQFNPADKSLPGCTAFELITKWVHHSPNAIALVAPDQTLTYDELDRAANRLAHHLIRCGVGAGAPVGVALSRNSRLIVTLLAIWKAGAAYVPVDPDWPTARQEFVLHAVNAEWLVGNGSWATDLPAKVSLIRLDLLDEALASCPDYPPAVNVTPDSLAYILFTSGSTGLPKAIETPHRAVVRLLHEPDFVPLHPGAVVPFLSALSFDAATFEIWGPLLHGGKLVVAGDVSLDLVSLTILIRRYSVTTLFLTTALFNVIADEYPAVLDGVAQLLVGGEAISPEHVRRALDAWPDLKISNVYGPTEATTFACAYPIPATYALTDGPIPIGRPINHTRAYVLDSALQPLPVGVPGELVLGGAGIALGYRAQPELTAERFLPDCFRPDAHSLLYRTGDRVRWRADGNLEYLGRLDRQLKVRGHRIEPGEIEGALMRHPCVRQVAIGVSDTSGNPTTLHACLVLTAAAAADVSIESTLRTFLRTILPAYLMPDRFHLVRELPRTGHGKLDLAAVTREADTACPSRPPVSETESALCTLASELLGGQSVHPDDDFFVIGGNSLLAVALLARIAEHFDVTFPLPIFFHDPSMAALARRLEVREPVALRSPDCLIDGVSGAQLAFRLVRRAQGPVRGVLIGMPGVLGHAGEIGFLAQHLLPDFDIYTFSIDSGGSFTLEPNGRSLCDPAIFEATRQAVVHCLRAPGMPRATAFLGFSISGYLAWMVERSLREPGMAAVPVLNLDGGVPDRMATFAQSDWAVLGARLRCLPNDPPTPLLLIHRGDVGGRRLDMHRIEDAWQQEVVTLCRLVVPTLDHLEVAVSPVISHYGSYIRDFIRSGSIDYPTTIAKPDLSTPGGRAFAFLNGHLDTAGLRDALADELSADGNVRLGLLEAALLAGDDLGALQYAKRLRALEPQERAAANVIRGLSLARGDFSTAREILRAWTAGAPNPRGLRLSARTTPVPAPRPPGHLVLGYEPSLDAAAANLRFPVLAEVHAKPEGLIGWAWDPHAPEEAVGLELLLDKRVLAKTLADKPIQGSPASAPEGRHGFRIAWPTGLNPAECAQVQLRATHDGTLHGATPSEALT